MRALAPYVAPAVLVLALLPLLAPRPAVGDNFQFWAAGEMVLTGRSPYDPASWEAVAAYGPTPGGVAANTLADRSVPDRGVWLYPPQTAYLFAPFGALPYEVGVPLLHLFVLVTACAGVLAAARVTGLHGRALGLALVCTVLSEPFVISVRNGHPIGLLLLGASLGFSGVRARRPPLVAAGAVVLSMKVHLFAIFGLVLLAYLAARRDVRSIAAGGIALAAITIPAQVAHPFPLHRVLASTDERLTLDLSTLAAFARDLGGGALLTLALALVLGTLCALAIRWVPPDVWPAVSFGALTLLSGGVLPYLHDYDLLVCVPAAFAAFAIASRPMAPPGLTALSAGVLVFVPWLLFYWWPLAGQSTRVFQGGPLGAAPLFFASLLAAAAFAVRELPRSVNEGAGAPPHEHQRGVAEDDEARERAQERE